MDAWFDCGGSLEVVEEVVGLGNYGRTLTVLWGESLPDPDDEEKAKGRSTKYAALRPMATSSED